MEPNIDKSLTGGIAYIYRMCQPLEGFYYHQVKYLHNAGRPKLDTLISAVFQIPNSSRLTKHYCNI